MQYTVYRTNNLINGKFYIGVHKTDDPQDDYLGSGKLIKRAVKKYGENNFSKEIFLITEIDREAFRLEEQLVQKYRSNPLCYNLRQGGSGGFDYINRVGLNGNNFMTAESVRKRQETKKKKFETDADFRRRCHENIVRIGKLVNPLVRERNRQRATKAWRGRKHTDKARKAMSEHAKGNKARLGIKCIYRDTEVKCVPEKEIGLWIENGWKSGRKETKPKPERRKTRIELAPTGMHWCSTHGKYLPIICFHKDKNRPRGLKTHCIECRKQKRVGKKW